jgi:hypothetical protein
MNPNQLIANDLAQYRSTKAPTTGSPDLNSIDADLQSYRSSKGATAPATGLTPPFKFDVPATDQDRQNKITGYNADAAAAKSESDKANSFGGFISNFGKAIVSNLAGSEVGLGKTIGETIAAPEVTKELTEANQIRSDTQVTLLKRIRENKALGKDTTRLEQTYNSVYGEPDKTPTVSDIVPSINKTTGQVAGELGGTALDILSAGTYGKTATAGMKTGELAAKNIGMKAAATIASPELGKVAEQTAQKATGAFTKKGAISIAKGAGVGYAQDVTQGLQGNRGENRTGAGAFIPGMGTAIGGGIPAITEGVQSAKNAFSQEGKAESIVNQRKKELGVLDDYASVSKRVQKAKDKGIDVKDIVANTDLLHGAVDKNGVISTKGEGNAVDQLQQFIQPQEDVISKNLKNEGVSLPASVVQKKLEYEVNQSGLKGGAKIRALNEVEQDMKGYMLDANKDGTIPLSVIHDAKVDKYSNINFMTEAEKQKSAKAIARGLKQLVENNTKSVDVKKLNSELSQHYAVLDYLNSLDGKRVEGGRLGKYFAKTVGAIVGGHFGPLGSIVGAETAGAIKGNSMASTFGGKIGRNLEQSEAMKAAIASGNTTKLPVKSMPSEYTNELPTIPFGQTPKLKVSDLPMAEGAPKVFSPEIKPSAFAKKGVGEIPKELSKTSVENAYGKLNSYKGAIGTDLEKFGKNLISDSQSNPAWKTISAKSQDALSGEKYLYRYGDSNGISYTTKPDKYFQKGDQKLTKIPITKDVLNRVVYYDGADLSDVPHMNFKTIINSGEKEVILAPKKSNFGKNS